jgi:PAS domain S-box-containing protein
MDAKARRDALVACLFTDGLDLLPRVRARVRPWHGLSPGRAVTPREERRLSAAILGAVGGLRSRAMLICVVSLLPAAIALAIVSLLEMESAADDALRQARRAANAVAESEVELLNRTQLNLSLLAQVPAIRNAALPDCVAILQQVVERQPWLSSVWVANTQGTVRCSNQGSAPIDRSGRSDHWDAVRTGRLAVSQYWSGFVTSKPMLALSLPFTNDEGAVATVGASIASVQLDREIARFGLPPGSTVSIFDRGGRPVYRNLAAATRAGNPSSEVELARVFGRVQQSAESQAGLDGVLRFYQSAEIPDLQAHVLVGIPKDAAQATALQSVRSWSLALLASAILGALIVSFLSSRWLLRPIGDLRGALGNPDHILPAPGGASVPREIAALHREFVAMQEHLKSREVELVNARERLAAIMDHTVDGLITIDESGIIEDFSLPASRIFGYEAAEVVGRNVSMLMPPPYRGEHDLYVANYLRGGDARVIGIGREVVGRRKDGRDFPMDLAVGELPVRDGKRRFVGTVRDTTRRREIEAQLHHKQKMEAIGQLTGGVAHDFNNLLAVIMANLELLAEDPSDPDAPRLIEAALRSTMRGGALTRQLLAYARRQPLNPSRVRVNDVVADIALMLARTLGPAYPIGQHLNAAVDLAVLDAGQLESAIMNLCLNARDAMPLGGAITLETANVDSRWCEELKGDGIPDGGYLCLAVSDEGTGMSPEVLAQAFEPFFTTKDIGKGSGLGLSMVYGFAKQSGGHVSIRSEPGRGTRVALYFRQNEADLMAPAVVKTDGEPGVKGRSGAVLLVEDEDGLRESLVRMLSAAGYTVTPAATGAEAIDILKSGGRFDLLLSDVMLPGGIPGGRVAEAAMAENPATGIVFMSGNLDDSAAHWPGPHVRHLHLEKPFTRESLLASLNNARSGRRATQSVGPSEGTE